MEMANNINLKPKYELLNSNFDGYKLQSEPDRSVYSRQIENGIFQRSKSDATCYLYTRMESLHNHLFHDPFEAHLVYLFNQKGHLLMFTFQDEFVGTPIVVWQEDIDSSDGIKSVESSFAFSPSLSFASSQCAVTSNGYGLLNILQTGDRSGGASWIKSKDLAVSPGSVVSSLVVERPEETSHKQELHVLLLSITSPEDIKKNQMYSSAPDCLINSKTPSLHIVFWLTFGFKEQTWELTRERRVAGLKTLEYLSLDVTGDGIVLLSQDHYYFLYDSVLPIPEISKKNSQNKNNGPKFMFQQNKEEVKLWINVGSDVCKSDLNIDVQAKNLKVQVKGSVVLEKTFLHPTDHFAATWKVAENNKLEICIPKSDENFMWPSLFEGGDEYGEEILDNTLVEEAHQRLAHLTSDQWNPDPDSDKHAFNPDQLEACDDASEELFLSILDGTSHTATHTSYLGPVQHLFNTQIENVITPAFCLRHDVDGILWQLTKDRNFDHVATFHAFGYVKASKSMAKFTQASPDNSYVAVADVNSHVYVFCQPGRFDGELKNRKTGQVSTTIARQLIVSLRNHDEVMGFYAAPSCVFVLTKPEIFVYSLQNS